MLEAVVRASEMLLKSALGIPRPTVTILIHILILSTIAMVGTQRPCAIHAMVRCRGSHPTHPDHTDYTHTSRPGECVGTCVT